MSQFSEEQIESLKAPLARDAVKTREQGKSTLSYVEAWHAIDEANRIFGFDAWDREIKDCRCVMERQRKIGQGQYQRDGWGVTYTATVRIKVGTIVREGTGAGHGIDADLGLAHESAIKEAESDAMKRALVTFGNPFGLALYDKTQANVEGSTPPANNAPKGSDQRTTDQRSPQGHRETQNQQRSSEPKPASSAEQKRQLAEIDTDLLDCHTDADVKRCADIWQSIATRDQWSRDYKMLAKEKFDAQRKKIAEVNDFPGDFPGSNDDLRQHPMNAG